MFEREELELIEYLCNRVQDIEGYSNTFNDIDGYNRKAVADLLEKVRKM